MANDPKYVRLADHLADSTVADIAGGSGWSIAGRDVREFPEEEGAARYVRSRLVQGLLEPAGKAEYDEVQNANKAVAESVAPPAPGTVPAQEGALQDAATKAQQRLAQSRQKASNDDDDEDGDEDEQSSAPAASRRRS